jgi:hypothetical protein
MSWPSVDPSDCFVRSSSGWDDIQKARTDKGALSNFRENIETLIPLQISGRNPATAATGQSAWPSACPRTFFCPPDLRIKTKKFEGKEKQGRDHPEKRENITGIEFLAPAAWEINLQAPRRSFGLEIEDPLSEKRTNLLRPT